MRKPPKRLETSIYTGDFHDDRETPEHLLDFTLTYHHLTGNGVLKVRYGVAGCKDGTMARLEKRFLEAARACDLRHSESGAYGDVYDFTAELPVKHGCDGDERARDIIRSMLEMFGVFGFSPGFVMNVTREYEVRVADLESLGDLKRKEPVMRWISEGQWAKECIAACFS